MLSLRLFSQISGNNIKRSITLSNVLSLRSFSHCLPRVQRFHTNPVIRLLSTLWIKYIVIIWIAKSLHLKIKQPTAPRWINLSFRIFFLYNEIFLVLLSLTYFSMFTEERAFSHQRERSEHFHYSIEAYL